MAHGFGAGEEMDISIVARKRGAAMKIVRKRSDTESAAGSIGSIDSLAAPALALQSRFASGSGSSSSNRMAVPCISKSSMKQRLFLRSKSDPLPPVVDIDGEDDQRDDENDTDVRRLSNNGQCARDPPSPLPLVLTSPLPISSSVQSFASSSRPGSASVNRGSGTTAVLVDNGTPSSSPLYDLKRVLKLIQDERHLVANELYIDVRRRIDIVDSCSKNATTHHDMEQKREKKGNNHDDEMMEAKRFCQGEEFQALKNRANLFKVAQDNLSIDTNWIHSQTLFGISTYYRRESDGSLSIKIDGDLHGVPLFEQLVVLRECDLYHHWGPFVTKSKKLAQLDKLDVVAWFSVGVPMLGLTRDACYRAVGCDCMNENGSVMLVAVGLNDEGEECAAKDELHFEKDDGQSNQNANATIRSESKKYLVDTSTSSFLSRDEIISTLEIPPVPQGLGSGRMTIRNFSASVNILSPTSARTKMVVNIDPNVPMIPQFMVDFIMKRMCGILLSRLQLAATKIVKHPTTNAHARRMREDVIFYRDWLLPKFRVYCDALGWRMPKVHAFEIDEDDLKADGMSWIEDNIDPTEFVSRQCQSDDEFSYISSSRPRAESAPSLISSSSTGSKASFRKLKSLLRQSSSRDDKIAAARLRAANLLRPQPFSDSNIHRLHDLKYARNRAEGRLQDKRVHGSIPDAAELKHSRLFLCVVILVASLFLRSLSVADSTQSTSVSSRGYCHLAAVIAQAYCLRTLLNCLFVYAFEEVDFGQRKFTNMTHGKNFFAMAVKRFTLTIAASVSAISCCIGFVVGVIVREICTLFVDLQKLVDLSHFSLSSSDDVPFFHIVDVVSSFRRIWATFRWGLLNLGFVLPEPLTKKAISFASASFTFFVSNGPLRECVSRPEVEEQWTSIALDISSFITLRLIVFSSALVMMARILLPKQVN